VSARGAALTLGLGYTLALLVWLLAQVYLTIGMGQAVAAVTLQGARVLFLLQALALALWLPLRISAEPPYSIGLGTPLLLLIPLPVFTFVWLTTDISAGALLAGELSLAAATVLAAALIWGARRLRPGLSLGPAAVQIAGLVLAWHVHEDWMRWLGL